MSLVKGGEKAVYCDYVILSQIMPLANIDPLISLDTYEPKDNEVVIYVPMCNTITGLYYDLTKKLAVITLRGDAQECFFSYSYSQEKSALLYCSMKAPLPNAFCPTCFQKHKQFLLDQNELGVKQSELFFSCLPLWIEKRTFFNGKIMFICIRLIYLLMI